MNYHPLRDYAVLIRVRLKEKMPHWLDCWEKIKAKVFPHGLQERLEAPQVSLISAPVIMRVFGLNHGRLPASGFELAWRKNRFSLPQALKTGVLSLLVLPLLLGLAPQKALAAQEPSRPDNDGSPISLFPAGLSTLAKAEQHALEVSDCPLKVKPRLLCATDCASYPHTFKLFSPSAGHLNANAWSNSTTGGGHNNASWGNTTNYTPITGHTNTHTNVPHTNTTDPGWLQASLPRSEA